MPTVRLERKGLAGPVGVVDTADARRFTIGGVLQGASLLVPGASSVESALSEGPGPVMETRYQLAWLLAGQRHPAGRGLMLGLGGGCGAVGLLHEFPRLALDAVEVDPAMAAMAREFHPLVGLYERRLRLRLYVSEALEHLRRSRGSYDFVIADLQVDADSLAAVDALPLIRGIAAAAPEAWFRVFGSLPDGELGPLADKFRQVGREVGWLYSPVSASMPIPRTRDWILASGVDDRPDPGGSFLPFSGSRGPRVREVQLAYRKLAREAMAVR